MDFIRRIFNSSTDSANPDANEKAASKAAPAQTPAEDEVVTAPLHTLPEQPGPEVTQEATPGADSVAPTAEEASSKEQDGALGVTRPLPQPQEGAGAGTQGHFVFGQSSDKGGIRSNNQDAALSFYFAADSSQEQPDFGIFIIADGMGGHKEGEKASALAANVVMTDIFRNIYLPILVGQEMNAERPTIAEALDQAVKKANAKIRQEVADGGTTLTAVVILGKQAHIAHVGDSRAYLIPDDGETELITRDHSVVQRLIELEQLSEEEAEQHEQKHVLYRAIGQNEEIDVDIHTRRLNPGAHLLICTDGLWGLVGTEEIQQIVTSTPDPQQACDKLVELANTNGGNDNISAILLKTPIQSTG